MWLYAQSIFVSLSLTTIKKEDTKKPFDTSLQNIFFPISQCLLISTVNVTKKSRPLNSWRKITELPVLSVSPKCYVILEAKLLRFKGIKCTSPPSVCLSLANKNFSASFKNSFGVVLPNSFTVLAEALNGLLFCLQLLVLKFERKLSKVKIHARIIGRKMPLWNYLSFLYRRFW